MIRALAYVLSAFREGWRAGKQRVPAPRPDPWDNRPSVNEYTEAVQLAQDFRDEALRMRRLAKVAAQGSASAISALECYEQEHPFPPEQLASILADLRLAQTTLERTIAQHEEAMV